MKIDTSSFCGLSTSHVWQSWLSSFDVVIYRGFLERLKANRGCSDNRRLMEAVLVEVMSKPSGAERLRDFLQRNFPYMLLDKSGFDRVVINELLSYFSGKIVTIPRRKSFSGAGLEAQVRDFCADKLVCEYLLTDGFAFVEFLSKSDSHLVDEISEKNWILSKYKGNRRPTDGT